MTIIDFYADWCGPCKLVLPTIQQLAQKDPKITLRKIDIVNWESEVSKQYHVIALPRVEIYGRKGQLIGRVGGADPNQVRQYVEEAKRVSNQLKTKLAFECARRRQKRRSLQRE